MNIDQKLDYYIARCDALAAEGIGALLKEIKEERAATLKTAQGGVTEAMVERAEAAREAYYEVDGNYPEHEKDFDAVRMAHAAMRAALEAALSAEPAAHPDDAAVDRFAAAMKEKLAEARAKGRGGWQDKANCPQQRLSNMLRSHLEKGDPRDVANFCMFLHERGESILPRSRSMLELAADPSLRAAPPAQPAERVPEGWKLAMLVLQSDLYRKLPEEERAVCDALVAENPYIAASPAAPAEEGDGKEGVR